MLACNNCALLWATVHYFNTCILRKLIKSGHSFRLLVPPVCLEPSSSSLQVFIQCIFVNYYCPTMLGNNRTCSFYQAVFGTLYPTSLYSPPPTLLTLLIATLSSDQLFYMKEDMRYLSFCAWFIRHLASLIIMTSSSIHFATVVRILFFYVAE